MDIFYSFPSVPFYLGILFALIKCPRFKQTCQSKIKIGARSFQLKHFDLMTVVLLCDEWCLCLFEV